MANRGEKTKYPNVYKLGPDKYLVRVRTIDPRTDKKAGVERTVTGTAEQALMEQQKLADEVRSQGEKPSRERFVTFATSLLRRKLERGEITSPATLKKLKHVYKHHLFPYFGEMFVDAIDKRTIDGWIDLQARKVAAGKLSPNTVNTRIKALRAIMAAAVADARLPAMPLISPLPQGTYRTYTVEQPNSLGRHELLPFFKAVAERCPQFFALLVLGLATGRRPCELLPLRRKGPKSDLIRHEDGSATLLIRRSLTVKVEDEPELIPTERTKTGRDLTLGLPSVLVGILDLHMNTLSEAQQGSDLLFPSLRTGEFWSLPAVIAGVARAAKHAKLSKHLTPRFLRRTFNDLMRLEGATTAVRAAISGETRDEDGDTAHDQTTRSISGHATAAMQRHYSTVALGEQAYYIDRIVRLIVEAVPGPIAGLIAAPANDTAGEVATPAA